MRSIIVEYPFDETLYFFLPYPLGPFKLARGEKLSDAELLDEAPVGSVGGGDEAGGAERELIGEGEDGARGEGDVVCLEDMGGDGGGGDKKEAAGGAELEEEERAVF